MRLKKIVVNHFGKLANLSISLDSKVTVVSGRNESGKSSLHTFIGAMLFGLERGHGRAAKNDTLTRFTPWDGGGYGGVIEFEDGDKRYSLTRNFSGNGPDIILTDETESRDVKPEHLPQLLHGLNASIYRNTISVNQLSASTGDALSDELRNHIVNLRSAGSFNLDIAGALNWLKRAKKRTESGFSGKAALEAEELELRIETMERELASSPELPSLSRLLAERELKESHLEDAQTLAESLNDTIASSEETLRSQHIGSTDEAGQLESRAVSMAEEISHYAKRHKINCRRGAKPVYVLLLVLAALAFGGLGYLTTSAYAAGGLAPQLIPTAAGAFASLILIVFAVINLSSVNRYGGLCEHFLDVYERQLGRRPDKIGENELSELIMNARGYQVLFDNIYSSRAKLEENKKVSDGVRGELAILNADIDRARELRWQFEQKEEALAALTAQRSSLDADIEKNTAINGELKAIDLASETLQRLSKEVFESFGHFLESTTSQLFADITGGTYSGVAISEELDITLIQEGRRVPLCCVSSGTLDQVYLALRLACIEFLWPDASMPLLLDDTFALYDDVRLARTLNWLCENYSGQIIIFSCHSREADILGRLGVKFGRVEM